MDLSNAGFVKGGDEFRSPHYLSIYRTIMATELTKPVSREINITDNFNVSGEVIVTMTIHGIELRRKRTARKLFISWNKLGKMAEIPCNAPAKYISNPLGWLVEKKDV